jgi:hypothetical protein
LERIVKIVNALIIYFYPCRYIDINDSVKNSRHVTLRQLEYTVEIAITRKIKMTFLLFCCYIVCHLDIGVWRKPGSDLRCNCMKW